MLDEKKDLLKCRNNLDSESRNVAVLNQFNFSCLYAWCSKMGLCCWLEHCPESGLNLNGSSLV